MPIAAANVIAKTTLDHVMIESIHKDDDKRHLPP